MKLTDFQKEFLDVEPNEEAINNFIDKYCFGMDKNSKEWIEDYHKPNIDLENLNNLEKTEYLVEIEEISILDYKTQAEKILSGSKTIDFCQKSKCEFREIEDFKNEQDDYKHLIKKITKEKQISEKEIKILNQKLKSVYPEIRLIDEVSKDFKFDTLPFAVMQPPYIPKEYQKDENKKVGYPTYFLSSDCLIGYLYIELLRNVPTIHLDINISKLTYPYNKETIANDIYPVIDKRVKFLNEFGSFFAFSKQISVKAKERQILAYLLDNIFDIFINEVDLYEKYPFLKGFTQTDKENTIAFLLKYGTKDELSKGRTSVRDATEKGEKLYIILPYDEKISYSNKATQIINNYFEKKHEVSKSKRTSEDVFNKKHDEKSNIQKYLNSLKPPHLE